MNRGLFGLLVAGLAVAGCARDGGTEDTVDADCASADASLPVPAMEYLRVDAEGRLVGRLAVDWPTTSDSNTLAYEGLDALEVWIDDGDGTEARLLGEANVAVASGAPPGSPAEGGSNLGAFLLDPGEGEGIRNVYGRVRDEGVCGPLSEGTPFVLLQPPEALAPEPGAELDLLPDPVVLQFRATDVNARAVEAALVVVAETPLGGQVSTEVAGGEYQPAAIDQSFEVSWSLIDAVRTEQERAIAESGAGTVRMEWRVRVLAPQGIRGDQELRVPACVSDWYEAGEPTCYYGP